MSNITKDTQIIEDSNCEIEDSNYGKDDVENEENSVKSENSDYDEDDIESKPSCCIGYCDDDSDCDDDSECDEDDSEYDEDNLDCDEDDIESKNCDSEKQELKNSENKPPCCVCCGLNNDNEFYTYFHYTKEELIFLEKEYIIKYEKFLIETFSMLDNEYLMGNYFKEYIKTCTINTNISNYIITRKSLNMMIMLYIKIAERIIKIDPNNKEIDNIKSALKAFYDLREQYKEPKVLIEYLKKD